MALDAEKVVVDALKLRREERTELVDRVLRSLDEEEDDLLDEEDRAQLHAAIAQSEEQFRHGQGIPAETVLERLKAR
jgi:methylphosphotriester-DNA--protein-cysteine methyltransferase